MEELFFSGFRQNSSFDALSLIQLSLQYSKGNEIPEALLFMPGSVSDTDEFPQWSSVLASSVSDTVN